MPPKGDTGKESTDATRFEEALAELEGVVRKLEKGELPLEDSLAAFERGMGLVKQLSKRLEDIERRVEVLLQREDGTLAVKPLDTGDDEE
jgi:exodeoxyribonuclease VII small subunit